MCHKRSKRPWRLVALIYRRKIKIRIKSVRLTAQCDVIGATTYQDKLLQVAVPLAVRLSVGIGRLCGWPNLNRDLR